MARRSIGENPRGSIAENTLWRRRALTIPPASWQDWLHLAVWEVWMGILICAFLFAGAAMITTAPDRIITAEDVSGCYASPPITRPCVHIVYRTGLLNAAFSTLFGLMSIVVGAWWSWELWASVAPKPITDDFLKLLNDSFARNWRDPRTWPWSRMFYAYGFTLLGCALAVGAGLGASRVISDLRPVKPPIIKVNTSQEFHVTSQP